MTKCANIKISLPFAFTVVSLHLITTREYYKIKVTLYNQSIPPFYLQQRFAAANVGVAKSENIDRLYYITSHLNTAEAGAEDGDAFIKDWKLMLATDTASLE